MTLTSLYATAETDAPSAEVLGNDGVLGLWQQWREDLRAHNGDWRLPGFRAIAVYRFGVWRMQWRWKLVRAPLSVCYRMLFRYVRNHYGIELPYSAQIGRRVEHRGR